VNHDIFIKKLKDMRFFHSVSWVASYLTGRTQVVRDRWNPVVRVLQSSVLGLVLFSLYLSDFGSIPSYCRYNFYADDLLIYLDCELSRLMETKMKINEDIDFIVD